MSVPSLEDLLAELDRQEELEAIEEVPTREEHEEVPVGPEGVRPHEQEGGSSASAAVRRRLVAVVMASTRSPWQILQILLRCSSKEGWALFGHGGLWQPKAENPVSIGMLQRDACHFETQDGDASTRDDERSPHTSWTGMSGQAAQEHHRSEEYGIHSSSSEEAESLPRVKALLSHLDHEVLDPERLRAQAEAAAFEERQRRARVEAEEQSKEDERRRVEAAREAWERHRMAAEEAEERRDRANRYAILLEEKTRKLVEKQSSKRKKVREDERRERQIEKEKQREERMRSEAAKMSERIRKMAENGYALGPSGWVRLDWLSSPADLGDPNFQAVQGPMQVEETKDEGPEDDGTDNEPYDPFEVVDQRPQREEDQKAPEALDLEDVLADLDQKQMEGMASGAQVADLDTVLSIVEAQEERDLAVAAAVEVRQGYEKLGEVEEEQDDLPQDATETATKVLRVAQTRRPDGNFGGAINAESSLKPFNDFIEEKQQGTNSYEERQARSAAIQAKLQAARNRLSIVRYERNSAPAPAPVPEKPSRAPKAEAKRQKPKMPESRERFRERHEPGWGWLQPGR